MKVGLSSFSWMQKFIRTRLFVFIIFLVLPYVFFAPGGNVFQVPFAPLGDGYIYGVPTKIFSGALNFWNPYVQTGTYALKDIGSQALYPLGIAVMRLFPNAFGYNLLLLFHYSMAGFFTYLFLRALKLKDLAAFIGGLTFMFCGFLSAQLTHHSVVMTASYLPAVLYFFESFMSSGKISDLFLAALAFGLSILADYAAVSMYIGMVSLPYIIFRVLTGPSSSDQSPLQKIFAIIRISSVIYVLGLMLAAVEVVPIIQSLKYVTREAISYPFFASYSFPLKLLPMLIFPYIYGGQLPATNNVPYFGAWTLNGMTGYMGILPILFAILALLLFRKNAAQIFFWSALALLAFVLVLGDSTPFYQLMYHVPVYNLFRVPARNWLEVSFAVAVLGAFFVHYSIADDQLNKRQYYYGVSWLAVLFCLILAAILGYGKMLMQTPEMIRLWSVNTRLTSSAVYIPLTIISLSIVFLYLLYNHRHNTAFWVLIMITLFLDLFSLAHFLDTGYMTYQIFQKKPNPVAGFLNSQAADKNQYRILTLDRMQPDNELYPSINILYGFNATNAYSPIWLKDYRNLTTFETYGTSIAEYGLLYNSRILSLLSTKYIITSDDINKTAIQNLYLNNAPASETTIVDGFNDSRWRFSSRPTRVKDNSAVLAAKNTGNTAVLTMPFDLQRETTYRISFKARMPAELAAEAPLTVDLGGKKYTVVGQKVRIDSYMLSGEFREISAYFYSGENLPQPVALRFHTQSLIPYQIEDVKLVKTSNQEIAYWGSRQLPAGPTALYEKKYESPQGIVVYENLNFLPRARFVNEVMPVADPGSAIYTLWYDPAFNPSTTALVEGFKGPKTFNNGEIVSADYSNSNAVFLSVRTGQNAFLVLSDSWYPGWKAFVDGKETEIYKTNAALRGIVIKGAGEHRVELRFIPTSFYLGLGITSAALLSMISVTLISHFKTTHRSGDTPTSFQ